ncbi:unnamed protein product [Closterium sp. NIES-65]|nr:unnamed protein product [Closterium sp. NIES-65]
MLRTRTSRLRPDFLARASLQLLLLTLFFCARARVSGHSYSVSLSRSLPRRHHLLPLLADLFQQRSGGGKRGQEEGHSVVLDGQIDGQIVGTDEWQNGRHTELRSSARLPRGAEFPEEGNGKVGGIYGDSNGSSNSDGTRGENVSLPHRYSLLDTTSTTTTSTLSLASSSMAVYSTSNAVATETPQPCSPLLTAVKIAVFTEDDFALRLQYSPRSTVILELQSDLALTRGLLFNASYACTILRSARAPPNGATLSLASTDEPLLRIWNTSNVLVHGISFQQPYTAASAPCANIPSIGAGIICPTVSIYGCHHVQVVKGTLFGRIDVFRSVVSRIDSMKVTGVSDFDLNNGVIRVAYCGYGPTLEPSYIAITNNEVYGVHTGIVIYRGAVGVTVRNNYVHDYLFAGIRCGADVSLQGDCMLSTISNNLVVATARNMSGDQDAAGIYYCTHWFNPGNVAECNYIYNGDHCYYLDYVSSGITVRGGACIGTYDGIKVNNGKWNFVEDVIMKNVTGMTGWFTCLTPTLNNCAIRPGTYWESMRRKYYDTPLWNNLWPWMKDICLDQTISGNPCNTANTLSAAQTGSCSGLPSDNFLDLVIINNKRNTWFKYCENLTTVAMFNYWKVTNVTDGNSLGFASFANDDLAVTATSPLVVKKPKFKSCSRGKVGPRRVLDVFYYSNFNQPEPDTYALVQRMGTKHIQDNTRWSSTP